MEVRVLRYFLAIAREGSISGAAEFLHLTQPTLSRQIHDLEDELGTPLLVRGSRNITLTDAGILLRRRAEEIVSLVDKTESEIIKPDDMIGGDIYIGGGETVVMHTITNIIKQLQRDYPQIHYHLFSGNAEDVKERLDKGLLDFGVLIEPTDMKKYNYLRLPSTDTWGLLMRKDSPLASNEVITAADLKGLPIMCSAQRLFNNDFSLWLGNNLEQLNIVATYNLIYNASLMVEDGIGYALTLDNLINTTGDSKLTFRPLFPNYEAHLDIVWKKYQVFSSAANVFLQKIQEDFG